MGEFDGTTFNGPIQTMREQQDATRSPLLIPLGPFSDVDIVASQTAAPFTLGDQSVAANQVIVMPHAGYIMGISASWQANFTVAAPTLTVQLDSVDTLMVLIVPLTVTEASIFAVNYGAANAVRFAADQRLRLVYDTIAGTAPATNDVVAHVWIG